MYIIVDFKIKKKLNVSANEYIFLKIVHHYQSNLNSKHPGWCYAGQKRLGEPLEIGVKAIRSMSQRLIKKNLLEKDNRAFLRTTKKWYEQAERRDKLGEDELATEAQGVTPPGRVSGPVEEVVTPPKVGRHTPSEGASGPTSNIIDNTIDNNKLVVSSAKEDEEQLLTDYFNALKLTFHAFYLKHKKTEYYFAGKDAGNLAKLVDKLRHAVSTKLKQDPTPEQLANALVYLLEGALKDDLIRKKFGIPMVNSQFNEIMSSIKDEDSPQIRAGVS